MQARGCHTSGAENANANFTDIFDKTSDNSSIGDRSWGEPPYFRRDGSQGGRVADRRGKDAFGARLQCGPSAERTVVR